MTLTNETPPLAPCRPELPPVVRGRMAPRGRRLPAWAATFVAACTGLGCHDSRITPQRFAELERGVTRAEPVAVQTSDMNLTEIKPYTVRKRDVLNITTVGLESAYSEKAFKVRVHDDGTIMLPLVGKVKVEGLDFEGVERAIIDAHVPAFVKDLSVYVDLLTPEPTTVLVSGAAGNRGLVTLNSGQRNLLYALAVSGGFASGTSGRVRVRPIRTELPELVYDLRNVNDVRRALMASPLESGDMLFVEPAESSVVYMMGLLRSPGPLSVPVDSTLPVSRAVAAAGGLPDLIDPHEATVWRRLPDGRQVRIKLDLAGIMAGRENDFELRAGDLFEVPHTVDTRIRDWIVQNLRIGPFSVGSRYDPYAQHNFERALDRNDDRQSFSEGLLQGVRFGISNLFQTALQPLPAVPTTP